MFDTQGVEQEYRGWIYRDLLRPIAEVDDAGNVLARYVYLDGEGSRQNGMHQLATRLGANQDTSLPFAGSNVPEYIELLDGSGAVTQTLRLVVNQVGTVQAVVDVATGVVVQRLEHDEFGRVLLDSNPGLQPFGFAGGLVDVDTGLVRFGARDYEPVTGRWTARDPVRFADGMNAYAYGSNEPIGHRDQVGLGSVTNNTDTTIYVRDENGGIQPVAPGETYPEADGFFNPDGGSGDAYRKINNWTDVTLNGSDGSYSWEHDSAWDWAVDGVDWRTGWKDEAWWERTFRDEPLECPAW